MAHDVVVAIIVIYTLQRSPHLGYGPRNFLCSASEPIIVCQCLFVNIPNGPARGTNGLIVKDFTTLFLSAGKSAMIRVMVERSIVVERQK